MTPGNISWKYTVPALTSIPYLMALLYGRLMVPHAILLRENSPRWSYGLQRRNRITWSYVPSRWRPCTLVDIKTLVWHNNTFTYSGLTWNEDLSKSLKHFPIGFLYWYFLELCTFVWSHSKCINWYHQLYHLYFRDLFYCHGLANLPRILHMYK